MRHARRHAPTGGSSHTKGGKLAGSRGDTCSSSMRDFERRATE
jgi:hypothetical protein